MSVALSAQRIIAAIAHDPLATAIETAIKELRERPPVPFTETYTPNGEPDNERLLGYAKCVGYALLVLIQEAVRQEVARSFERAAKAVRGREVSP